MSELVGEDSDFGGTPGVITIGYRFVADAEVREDEQRAGRRGAVDAGVFGEGNPLTADAMGAAMKTVLWESSYRAHAQELQREIKKFPSHVEAVKRLEIFSETRLIEPLTTPAERFFI